jgi:uncharacterized protein (DUF433 family)
MSIIRSGVSTGRDAAVQRIVSSPEICGGHARVAGTRIPIAVLVRCRALGMSDERILQGYPSLTAEDLAAVWQYAEHLEVPAEG